MSALRPTRHAVSRMSQRAISVGNIDLVLVIGTEVEGGVLVRRKDAQRFERRMKELIDQARRLVGKRVVMGEEGVIITAYHASRGKQRRLLRNAEERSLSVNR